MPVPEIGPPDAYGHRKKVNIAEFLADALTKRIHSVRLLPVDRTYSLRSARLHQRIRAGAEVIAHVQQSMHVEVG